jgi:L-glutamine-phosphate cytidylyltransferase
MKAVILAAGIGSRLKPLTDIKPKTMVAVNGTPMIGRIIASLVQGGVDQIIICSGYLSDVIRRYSAEAFPHVRVTFVENTDYRTTNNMFSLYLAREYLVGDCLIMNADLCFDSEVIPLLVAHTGSAFAVDSGKYIEESMKVVVHNGIITAISKQLQPHESYGCSIDVYKIDGSDTAVLVDEMRRIIDVEGIRNQWTEVMLNRLCNTGRLRVAPVSIGTLRWYEVDNFDDLRAAELLFSERPEGFGTKHAHE